MSTKRSPQMRSANTRQDDPARARISARVSKSVQARLEEASDLVGATVNQFMVQAALREADRIIEHERVILPTARDARMILESLDRPSPPNAKLRAALKRYKEVFDGASNRAAG